MCPVSQICGLDQDLIKTKPKKVAWISQAGWLCKAVCTLVRMSRFPNFPIYRILSVTRQVSHLNLFSNRATDFRMSFVPVTLSRSHSIGPPFDRTQKGKLSFGMAKAHLKTVDLGRG